MRLTRLIILGFIFFSFLNGFSQSKSDLLEIGKIHQKEIKSKRLSSYDKSGRNNDRLTHIQDGEKATLFDVDGAGIINHIWITIAPLQPKISRNDIIIRMYWDGNDFPSVESPIGPFFGQGWNECYPFSSLPLAAAPRKGNALISYFTMPFSNGARIEIENQSGQEIEAFYYYVDYYEYQELPSEYGRFHAWYNKEVTDAEPEKEDVNLDAKFNYLIADIKGTGQFVGVNYYVNSPSPIWYGEGDDMIFIDDEEMPALYGTGTEDYFNSSWSPKESFSHPYFGYGRVNGETGFLGRTHVYRFHISDPIYFDKSLKFTIEHGHANNLTLDLASVAYWYQSKASALPFSISKEKRKPMPAIGPVQMYKWRKEWQKNNNDDRSLWGNE